MSIRFRRKLVAALACTMAVSVLAIWVQIARMPRRQVFHSTTDRATGYRCRFTIPASWEWRPLIRAGGMVPTDGNAFAPPDRTAHSPLMQWLEHSLLRRPYFETKSIHWWMYSGKTLTGTLKLQDGYPDLQWLKYYKVLSKRHLTVDGCQSTIVSVENPEARNSAQCTFLLVYVANPAILYCVTSNPEVILIDANLVDPDPLDIEIQGTIASFHVEKVAGSTAMSSRP